MCLVTCRKYQNYELRMHKLNVFIFYIYFCHILEKSIRDWESKGREEKAEINVLCQTRIFSIGRLQELTANMTYF